MSFVGARVAPSAQFWLTLPGGIAVARAAERGAAGPEGTRQVFRGMLDRLQRFSWARQAEAMLDRLDAGSRLVGAGSAFLDALGSVPRRPAPLADAATAWVAAEAARGPHG